MKSSSIFLNRPISDSTLFRSVESDIASQEHLWQSTAASPQPLQDVHLQPYGIFYLGGVFKGNKTNERQKKFPRRLTMRNLCGKSINNIYCLSYFYYCRIFPKRRHVIIIRTLVVPKIFCLSCPKSWCNILDPDRKRQAVMRMKVDSNKGIYTYFGRNVLDCCRYDHDDLPMVDPSMNLPPCQLQELPCLSLVLICLEFIICLIESACTSLLLTNLDPLL